MGEGGQMMIEYVGLVKGKVHDKHEMSEYYCGGCGYPVTDHDSYCRECGGALHEGMTDERYTDFENWVSLNLKAMAYDLLSPNPFKTLEERREIVEKYKREIVDALLE